MLVSTKIITHYLDMEITPYHTEKGIMGGIKYSVTLEDGKILKINLGTLKIVPFQEDSSMGILDSVKLFELVRTARSSLTVFFSEKFVKLDPLYVPNVDKYKHLWSMLIYGNMEPASWKAGKYEVIYDYNTKLYNFWELR